MIQVRIRRHYAASRESAAFRLDVEFQSAGGVTVLFGPSGAGKTLTLDCIAGFVRASEGRIVLDEVVLFDHPTGVHLAPRDRRCGYVFQNYALFPHMTLRGNLEFAAERLSRLERHRRVSEMLERFRLGEVAGRRPHELSGGQRQRCSIARALLTGPRLLLLDEPARGLDAPLRAEFYEALRQVREEFATPVLLVTHDLSECFELGDEMLVMRDGKVVQAGAPRKVAEQPASLEVARLLGLYNLLPVEIRALDPGNNSSRLRMGEAEFSGPYFPGRLKGDRASLYVKPSQLHALPRGGRPAANQIAASLERAIELPHAVRLQFEGGLAVEIARAEFERHKHNKDWVVEFPAAALRLL